MLTYLGFAILGLVNAIVPFIVHSANYLIIPYPRWIVLLIETLPALVTKLLMPHVLHRVPYWMRPLTIGAGWIIVAIVTNVTPPNIAPPLRILTSVLASISAAAMEVSFLGMLRYYGRVGLAGWGAGVGAGAVFCAILPFVLTVWLESFLRDFIDCIYALTGAMLVAFFVVLPGAPVNYPHAQQEMSKVDVEDASLLAQDPVEQLSRMLSTRNRLNLTKAMIRPFMMPLFGAFAIQALAYPGIARALPLPTSYTSFFSYFTTYGLAFQLGNFISRTHTLLFRPTSTKAAFTIIGASTFILLANSTFLIFSAEVLVGLLAFGAGLGGGAVSMTIFDRALQDKSFESEINLEFGLQIVGVGETTGVIVALEVALCGGAVVVEEDYDTYYAKLAVEYYDKASRSFRAQLENVNSENAQKIFMFSFLAVAVNMALGQCSAFEELYEGVLERMVTLWELLMGNASIANQHFDALISGALSRSTEALMLRTQLQTETPTSLSKETEEALESLSTIINKACEAPSGSTPNNQSEASVRISSYRTSFSAIQTCFVQDSKDVFKGMAIGFPALAGREFGLALKSSDPVALLLMVFWGVQLDTLGKVAWWVGTFGKKMVDEVSEMLWEPDPGFEVMTMSEWRECITWARTEVGLTPIVETTEE
nr:hypothetical protein FVER53263_00309 [Fusarium verticillioides]